MCQASPSPLVQPWRIMLGAPLVLVLAVLPAAAQPPPSKQAAPPPDQGAPMASGPVAALQQALRVQIRDSNSRDEVQYRKENLEKHVKALTRIDDLRRALLLQEWRDDEREEAIDRPLRAALGQSLLRSLREVLQKGSPVRKQAAATLIADSGITVRGVGSRGLMSALAPDLVKLLDDEDKAVRAAAALALGQIIPEPAAAAAALGKLLAHKDAGTRQAAANGLAGMLRTMVPLSKGGALAGGNRGFVNQRIEITREDVFAAAVAVAPVAGRGLADTSALVRRRCLEALQLAADQLTGLVIEGRTDLSALAGRKLGRQEKAEIDQYRKQVEAERKLVLPLVKVLAAQVSAMNAALADKDVDVCLAAGMALESAANARQRLLQKAASVPGADKPEDPFRAGMQATVPAAAKLLAHKEVRARLAALYVLETLGAEAAPAADALTLALADDDPFVRWGAARATAQVAPKAAATTVPALAKLLNDDNHDVRITAVAALRNYGPAAEGAVPALAKAVGHKDVSMRVPAIQALASMKAAAKDAAPALVKALADPESAVRRAAAEALGEVRATSGEAGDALRKALNDLEAEVRQAASAALLGVP